MQSVPAQHFTDLGSNTLKPFCSGDTPVHSWGSKFDECDTAKVMRSAKCHNS